MRGWTPKIMPGLRPFAANTPTILTPVCDRASYENPVVRGRHMPLDNSDASHLEARLRREIRGAVLFDRFNRGRYATDASIYQIEPLGVVVPRSREDAAAAIAIARDEGVPVLPRGAGTSQCGQTVARALVIDCSK